MLMTTSILTTISRVQSEANDLRSAFKEVFPIMTFTSGASFLLGAAVTAFVFRCTNRRFGPHGYCYVRLRCMGLASTAWLRCAIRGFQRRKDLSLTPAVS